MDLSVGQSRPRLNKHCGHSTADGAIYRQNRALREKQALTRTALPKHNQIKHQKETK